MPLMVTDIEDKQKPRLMYLDVDDTLLVWNRLSTLPSGFPAPRAAEFITWALEHFEVRWLTMWCPSGIMDDGSARELAYRFNNKILADEFKSIQNPKAFEMKYKTDAIDFDDPRPWVWVEDDTLTHEEDLLRGRNLYHNFYPTNVSIDPVRLQQTWRMLANRFELPGAPDEDSTDVELPSVILTHSDIIQQFRR